MENKEATLLENGNWKCNFCQNEYKKYGIKNHIAIVHYGDIKRVQGNKGKNQIAWNKGLTKEIDERIKKYGRSISKTFLIKPPLGIGRTEEIEIRRKEKISLRRKEFCKNIKERKRLKEIGRKGGFGKKGYTVNGNYYESNFEKICFEYLENKNIKFEAHKYLPNTSRVSDLYLPDLNLWIELDGIDREKRKKWLRKNYDKWIEKIQIYENQNLNYKIIKNFEEFARIV